MTCLVSIYMQNSNRPLGLHAHKHIKLRQANDDDDDDVYAS